MDSEDILGILVVLLVCEAMMCGGNQHSVIWRLAAWLQDVVDQLDRPQAIAVKDDVEEDTTVEENVYAEEEGDSWRL